MVKVAVVTGANRGIGLEIVRGLCKKFDGTVYLTARSEERGKEAIAELNKEGLKANYYPLDVTVPKSVEAFRDYLKEKYGGIDVLVNNAGMAFKADATESLAEQAETTVFVNYFCLLSVSEILFPIIRNGGRVVNLSSALGHSSLILNEEYKQRFLDPELTIPKLSGILQEYVEDVKKGVNDDKWAKSPYIISKCGVTALSFLQQKQVNDRDIKVNAVHPGYVKTGLTSFKGHISPEEGAVSSLYLVLDAPDSIKGQFVWYNNKIVSFDGPMPAMT